MFNFSRGTSSVTQVDAILEAFKALGGDRRAAEIEAWVTRRYGTRSVDYGTRLADMVHPNLAETNTSSNVPVEKRVLRRVDRGLYCLI